MESLEASYFMEEEIEKASLPEGELDHSKTPIFTTLKEFTKKDVAPFYVPGHKHGKGLKEFTEFLGNEILEMDIPALPEETDNLCNPTGIIKESQELIADAFGAEQGHFLVNGTSEGVQVMIRSAVQPGEEIIIPRNAHKSTVGALILSGAIPNYVYPEISSELGIPTVVTSDSIKENLKSNPFTKAVFVINPSYYGMVSDLESIVRISHGHGAAVLADEAHGAHMKFHPDFPKGAMEAGADMSAASLHKTCGSMTQSSVLLQQGDLITHNDIMKTLNLTRTTSPSFVLMSSIDVARKQLVLQGKEMLDNTLELVRYARRELNSIQGVYAFDSNMIGNYGIHNMDETKLGVHIGKLNISGFELEKELRNRFGVIIEMAEVDNILALFAIGESKEPVDRLVRAFKTIARERGTRDITNITQVPSMPELVTTPREAYYSTMKSVSLDQAIGEISGEMLMAYPPGIPVICPGERITKDVVDYIRILKEQKAHIQGTVDPEANKIRVIQSNVVKIRKIG